MMTVKDGAQTRKLRIDKLLDIIQRNPELEEKRIKALFTLQTGLTRRRVEEYIEELEEMGLIRRENGKIILNQ